jgi:hypothetical protein
MLAKYTFASKICLLSSLTYSQIWLSPPRCNDGRRSGRVQSTYLTKLKNKNLVTKPADDTVIIIRTKKIIIMKKEFSTIKKLLRHMYLKQVKNKNKATIISYWFICWNFRRKNILNI